MSEDSKRREALLKQIVGRGKELHISYLERVWNYLSAPKKWDLVEKTATIPGNRNIEDEYFVICLDHLRIDICDLEFDGVKMRSFVRLLHRIATCKANALVSSGIVRDNITSAPPYENLFNNLSPDIEVKEAELSGGGRLFFFVVGRKFNIISIEARHRDAHHRVGY